MPFEIAVALLGLAVVDSINPSALVIAGIILAKSRSENRVRNLLAYISGIFVTYLSIGLAVLAGLDELRDLVGNAANSRTAFIVQAVIGGLLLLYALLAPSKLSPEKQKKRDAFLQQALRPRRLFGYGMYITAIELITALPYFVALALLANAELSFPVNVAALVMYCLIFVAPPLMIAYIYYRKRTSFDTWLKRRSNKKGQGREAVLWLMGIIGFYALVHALSNLGIISTR